MEGIIFKCQQCGYCCDGETTVSLDEDDVKRMCDYLQMDFTDVKERYLRVTGSTIQMKTIDGHCIFYDEGCTVHPGRPWRCAQWPLHPSILADEANFLAITASCPGLKQEIGYQQFCQLLSKVLAEKAKNGWL